MTREEAGNLAKLLEQDTYWVPRARWVRWLRHGNIEDTGPISEMSRDARFAAYAWIIQQRHLLHATIVEGAPARAPEDWAASLPLVQALRR